MLNRTGFVVLIAALTIGCQQGAEQQAEQKTEAAPETTPRKTAPPPRPAYRQSDARLSVESVTLKRGESSKFKIDYYGVDVLKAFVIPLTLPHGMMIDSVSFAGSVVEYIGTRPVRIDNEESRVLISAIPTTEPFIPVTEGLLATFYFHLSDDAVSGQIEEGFTPPANYLVLVDTANRETVPIFEPGTLTVESVP